MKGNGLLLIGLGVVIYLLYTNRQVGACPECPEPNPLEYEETWSVDWDEETMLPLELDVTYGTAG